MSQEHARDWYFISAQLYHQGTFIHHTHLTFYVPASTDPSSAMVIGKTLLLNELCEANGYNPKALKTQVIAFNRV